MPSPNAPIPVDLGQWSEESRRSLFYVPAPNAYEDRPFTCRKCGCRAVFTAEQQKHEYEVKKAHTLQRHILCRTCFIKRHELAGEDALFSIRWKDEKSGFKKDSAAIKRWIEVLTFLPTYGGYKDAGRIRMLEKLLFEA